MIARLPYGAATSPVEAFAYEEAPKDADRRGSVRWSTRTIAG